MAMTQALQNSSREIAERDATIAELHRIIDRQKREIEHLRLSRARGAAIKSNLSFLDTYPRKGMFLRVFNSGCAGTVSR